MLYRCPHGYRYPALCEEVLHEPNVLIGGCAGSGKSVLLQSIIYTICCTCFPGESIPESCALWLADPKMVELDEWKCLPHCNRYEDTVDGILSMMDDLIYVMDRRYAIMKSKGLKKWNGGKIFFIIDELADLMVTEKKKFTRKFAKLMNKSRAAEIHIIACTQSPSRLTIPAEAQVNYSMTIGLKCRTAIESRQLVGIPGAESLPRYGKGIVSSADGIEMRNIIMTDPTDIARIKHFWTSKECRA